MKLCKIRFVPDQYDRKCIFPIQFFSRVVFLDCWLRVLHMLISEGKSPCNDQACPCAKDRNMLAKVQARRQNKRCSSSALFEHLFFRFLKWKCVEKFAAVRAGLGKKLFSKKFRRTLCHPLCQLCAFWARSQNCEKRLLDSSCPYVCPLGRTRLPLDRFSWNLLFEYFTKNLSGKFKFY